MGNVLYEFVMRVYYFQVVDCFDPDSFEDQTPFEIWLTQYLLDLEVKGKNLPHSTFCDERGKFEIPFETDVYKNWVGIYRFQTIN